MLQVTTARLRREQHVFEPTWESMEQYYVLLIQSFRPISEHLPTLRRLATGCENVAELGTCNGNSAFALMMGRPKTMRSVDLQECGYIDHLLRLSEISDTSFWFIRGDSREFHLSTHLDLLLVDTDHTYDQVKAELQLYKDQCRRYIVFHDTSTFPEIVPAIEEELTDFHMVEEYTNGHGLQVWERR